MNNEPTDSPPTAVVILCLMKLSYAKLMNGFGRTVALGRKPRDTVRRENEGGKTCGGLRQ